MKTAVLPVTKTIVGILFLSLCLCGNAPTVPDSKNAGLCDKPTNVSNVSPDSVHSVVILEIYDYEKRLIKYSLGKAKIKSLDDIHFYWNGTDKSGKPVDDGKYTVKVSLISEATAACTCMDVFTASAGTSDSVPVVR